MRDLNGEVAQSQKGRFILGAGIGVAISIPIFAGIDNIPVQIPFMAAFATIMGFGQVLAGRNTASTRKITRLAIVIGVVTLLIGFVAFLFAA